MDASPREMPTVSVVVPVHNGGAFLRPTLESVRQQSLAPLELILIDDGSTDSAIREVLDGLQTSFPVRLERQENAGQSAARNRGVAMAQGELIAFLDQDDLWHRDHLAALVPPLRDDPDQAWVFSDFDEIDGSGNLVTRGFLRSYDIEHPKHTIRDCIVADLMVLPSASIIRRSAILEVGGFDERLQGYEDDDLFVRIFRAGGGHARVSRPLTRFRIHPVSCSTQQRFIASRLRYAEKLCAMFPDDGRMHRYYFSDYVAPRFFNNTLDDYVRACSRREWPEARFALGALLHFAKMRRPGLRLHFKLLWLRHPRLFRALLRLNERLPTLLRPTSNPLLRLR
jgi:glycosyltransferase involved in cell wall biosynthesis